MRSISILALLLTSLIIVSCSRSSSTTPMKVSSGASSSGVSRIENSSMFSSGSASASASDSSTVSTIVKTGSTVSVDYTGRLEDGTIFDSSRSEDAKKSSHYSTGRTYEPLTFTVGQGQMIKGFDQGVIGMRVGEKKTITMAPKDAYGEATMEMDIPKKSLQDTITQDIPAESFQDVVRKKIPKTSVPKPEALEVGQTINAGGTSAKVVAIDDQSITFEFANDMNPFHDKEIKSGVSATYEGNTITIKEVKDTTVTVEIDNKANPFYGNELKVGLVGKTPNGQDMTIESIGDDTIKVSTKNTHELAGKTLTFDVEIITIK